MNSTGVQLFPALFLANVKIAPDKPFIYERHEKMFVSRLTKEIAVEVNGMARMLDFLGVTLDSRVAFFGLSPSKAYWVSELATFSIRATAVIIPSGFSEEEKISVLAESRSTVAVVNGVAEANVITRQAAKLPELKHIICLTGKPAAPETHVARMTRLEDLKGSHPGVTVYYYAQCLEKGGRHPDRTPTTLAALSPRDRAILFFYHDNETKGHKVTLYTHAQLLEHARVIERLLGTHSPVHNTDIVLTALSWNHLVEHISSCLLPVLRDSALQINSDKTDFTCLESRPQVLIADADYVRSLKQHIEAHMKRAGKLEWKLFQKAIAYGKRKYEKEDRVGFGRKLSDRLLDAIIVKKVIKMLGGRLRLIIGIDDAASYEVHTFFHTFGVELVEMPAEAFNHIKG